METREDTDGNIWVKTDSGWKRAEEAKKAGLDLPPIAAATIGTLRTFDKLKSGAEDLRDIGIDKLGMGNLSLDLPGSMFDIDSAKNRMAKRKSVQENRDQLFSAVEGANPISAKFGEVAPYLAGIPFSLGGGAVSTATHLMPKAGQALNFIAGLGKAAAQGAAEGAVHYDDTAKEGALWGAGGKVAGDFIGNLLGGTRKTPNPVERKTIEFAEKHNLFVPPGMSTGNPRLQQLDRAFERNSVTAPTMQDFKLDSKQKENALIAKEMGGEHADLLSPEYLELQRTRITDNMTNLANNADGYFTFNDISNVNDIIDKYKNLSPMQETKPILEKYRNTIADLVANKKQLSGAQYQKAVRNLKKSATTQFLSSAGDKDLGKSLSDIANLFNTAIDRGMDKTTSKAFKKANREFALLNSVQETMDISNQANATGASGYVDTDLLARKFKTSDVINNLGKLERLRKNQQGSSLSTSALVAKAMDSAAGMKPSEAMGPAFMLSPRITQKLPFIPDALASLYLKGYPHATGVAPIFGRKYTEPLISELFPKLAISRDQND